MAAFYDYVMDPSGDVYIEVLPTNAGTIEEPASEAGPYTEPDPDVEGESHTEPYPSVELEPNAEPASEVDAASDTVPESSLRATTFLVSSRHLILASPVLKAMMTGPWSEGSKVNGMFRLSTEGWDVEALAIVLNTIHGRWRHVPKAVSLELLAKIAAITDYYDIREAIELVSLLWMKAIRQQPVPNFLERDTFLPIWVSWVFKRAVTFRQATQVAILRSREGLEAPSDIPVPPSVLDKINEHRRGAVGIMASSLRNLLQSYIEGGEGCDFDCSSIHLGALMKHLHDLKYLKHDMPDTPFGNQCLVDVVESLREIEFPKLHDHRCPTRKVSFHYWDSQLGVGGDPVPSSFEGVLAQHVAAFLQQMRAKTNGLELH